MTYVIWYRIKQPGSDPWTGSLMTYHVESDNIHRAAAQARQLIAEMYLCSSVYGIKIEAITRGALPL